jgi:sec-independent protein translocase protein TatA
VTFLRRSDSLGQITKRRKHMGLSFWHLIIILVIVLLLFGPNRLPNLGKSVGEAIRGFKKGIEGDEIDVTKREQIKNADEQASRTQKESDKNKA